MDPAARVCPFCGRPPGVGVFCAGCGRNLSAVDRLPTAAEFNTHGRPPRPSKPLSVRAADATAEFLAAMREAGNPGVAEFPTGKPRAFRRPPSVSGWIVRPVDREDFEEPRRYEPGLLLAVDGRFHRLDSELRGWGQRDFPRYTHIASPDAIEAPVEERLIEDLAGIRAAVLPE